MLVDDDKQVCVLLLFLLSPNRCRTHAHRSYSDAILSTGATVALRWQPKKTCARIPIISLILINCKISLMNKDVIVSAIVKQV